MLSCLVIAILQNQRIAESKELEAVFPGTLKPRLKEISASCMKQSFGEFVFFFLSFPNISRAQTYKPGMA